MITQESTSDDEVWLKLVQTHQQAHRDDFPHALEAFRRSEVNRVALVRRAVRRGQDSVTVATILEVLDVEELKQLFDELIYLASWVQGSAGSVRTAIARIPKDWTIQHLPSVAALILSDPQTTPDAYRRLLELYYGIDHDLTRALALQALGHTDTEVREAGADFLDALTEH
jgi:hypothetical protein